MHGTACPDFQCRGLMLLDEAVRIRCAVSLGLSVRVTVCMSYPASSWLLKSRPGQSTDVCALVIEAACETGERTFILETHTRRR